MPNIKNNIITEIKKDEKIDSPQVKKEVQKIELEQSKNEFKYIKVVIICQDKEGKLFERSLNNREAEKWEEYMIRVCQVADSEGMNPDWASLNWVERELKLDNKN